MSSASCLLAKAINNSTGIVIYTDAALTDTETDAHFASRQTGIRIR